jgi:L-cysteine S-thiosulfotransferase
MNRMPVDILTSFRYHCLSLCRAFPLIAFALWLGMPGHAQAATAEGRALFTDARRGNCAACHQLPNDPAVKSSATIGPVLAGVKARFPERTALRNLLWDPTAGTPGSSMPPYGKHRILNAAEIDKLMDYLEAF